MAIKILHLYNNLMNLYGEYANISILDRHIRQQGANAEITRSDSCNGLSPADFDFIYIGSGTEKAQKRALADLMTKRQELKAAADNGTVMLFTGNAFEMLGSFITDDSGKKYEALSLSEFETTESFKKRITGDAVCTCRFIEKDFVGFINKCSNTTGIKSPLFTMKLGYGNCENDKGEGIRINNVFGTHLIGPILVKNPHFTRYILNLIAEKTGEFIYRDFVNPYEQEAYDTTLRELNKRMV